MTYLKAMSTVPHDDDGTWFSKITPMLKDDGTPDFGAIYREAQAEYGRCQSSVYVDVADGPPKRVVRPTGPT